MSHDTRRCFELLRASLDMRAIEAGKASDLSELVKSDRLEEVAGVQQRGEARGHGEPLLGVYELAKRCLRSTCDVP